MKRIAFKRILKLTIVTFLFSTFWINAYSWAYIYINDPQEWWWGGEGTIEEAIFTLHPQGAYTEVGMYLTFSARELYFTNDDTVEVVMDFNLPEGSIIHDSWLWINDSIVKADIIDRWTATTIYEEIVGRRQDPSILYKNWGNQYQLRIFPMAGDESRKVKISVLIPNKWSKNGVNTELPLEILHASMNEIPKIEVRFAENDTYFDPELKPNYTNNFLIDHDNFYETSHTIEIDYNELASSMIVNYDAPLDNGVFISTYQNAEEQFYNMVLIPSLVRDMPQNHKKVLFLVDYDASKTYTTKDELYESLIFLLETELHEKDSFCVAFAGLNTKFIHSNWLAITQANVDAYLKSFEENPINSYSNLPTLMTNGINFIKDNGGKAEIILLSDNDNNGENTVANELIDDLISLMGDEIIPVNVVNFISKNYNWYFYNGTYYIGSEYFFINMAKQTKGNYYYVNYNNTLSTHMESAYLSVGNFLTSVDLHTYVHGGFCHSRYNISPSENLFFDKPIIQVGKYIGEMPFYIQFSGVNNNVPFNNLIEVGRYDVHDGDTLHEEIWCGNYIDELEESSYDNQTIIEIIDRSIEDRVLSRYTAFLAIDPALIPDIEGDDNDGWTDIDNTPESNKEFSINTYPNPFKEFINIELDIPDDANGQPIQIFIYNIMGQIVWSEKISKAEDKYTIKWDGKDLNGRLLQAGTYILRVSSKKQSKSVKIIKY